MYLRRERLRVTVKYKREQPMIFEWDENKNSINFKKHGISFEEAITVFKDYNAVLVYDKYNSEGEDRFNIIGISQFSRALIVCHCYRDNDTVIRIISARKTTKTESEQYGGAYE
jgi:uncharacterized DUF497 family protein